MKRSRSESDSLGVVQVPQNKYWGAQTQRSLKYFKIGNDPMPLEIIRAFALQKKTAAMVNRDLKKISNKNASAILKACDEVISGKWDDQFPLVVWQTGSGTQTNMNMNEVIANRASEILTGKMGTKSPIHPIDHINMGQSSNDSFPTVMHIAAVFALEDHLLPALKKFHIELVKKEKKFSKIIKVGRTHLMDAVPLTLGQEFSGYRMQIELGIGRVEQGLERLRYLAQGGTGVGTGMNTHKEFAERFSKKLSQLTKKKFLSAPNKFEALAGHDALVFAHGALKTVAISFMKIANDIRWLGSGPRCGLNELSLPANEPGSSFMPGKVNPTQCESMAMVSCQVMGHDVALNMGAANGNFELNVFKPLIIFNFLHSAKLLGDSANSFVLHCLKGLKENKKTLKTYTENNLMLVTSLSPHIGYDKAALIAKKALEENISIQDAALSLKFVTSKEFKAWVNIPKMLLPEE